MRLRGSRALQGEKTIHVYSFCRIFGGLQFKKLCELISLQLLSRDSGNQVSGSVHVNKTTAEVQITSAGLEHRDAFSHEAVHHCNFNLRPLVLLQSNFCHI